MNELKAKRLFRTSSRASGANNRFEDKITGHDVYEMLVKYDYKCFYCNVRIKATKWQLDHFHPRANGGLNHPDNIVPCCRWCNTMKNALDGNAFIKKCTEIVEFNYFKRMNMPADSDNFYNSAVYKTRLKKVKKYIESIDDKDLTHDLRELHDIATIPDFNETDTNILT